MENSGGGIQKRVNKPVKPITVILADDHTLVRAGIRALLEKLPEVKVIGEAGDGREVLNLVKAQPPDVVLMDIAMPGLNGLEAAERMARDFPDVRIIILSMHNNEEYVLRAIKGGRGRLPAQEIGDGRTGNRLAPGVARGNLFEPGNLHAVHRSFPCTESPAGKARWNS